MRLLPIIIMLLFQKAYASTISLDNNRVVTSLAFGSCIKEHKKQKIWQQIKKDNPDLFIFLGDNIYADTEDMAVMKAKYKKLTIKVPIIKEKGIFFAGFLIFSAK